MNKGLNPVKDKTKNVRLSKGEIKETIKRGSAIFYKFVLNGKPLEPEKDIRLRYRDIQVFCKKCACKTTIEEVISTEEI